MAMPPAFMTGCVNRRGQAAVEVRLSDQLCLYNWRQWYSVWFPLLLGPLQCGAGSVIIDTLIADTLHKNNSF